MSFHALRSPCAPPAILVGFSLLIMSGCVADRIGMFDFNVDSPMVQPAPSTPADSSTGFRISVWSARPVVREQTGYYESSASDGGPWEIDSVATGSGTYAYKLKYEDPPEDYRHHPSPNLRWRLPEYQVGVYVESPLIQNFRVGVAAQASQISKTYAYSLEGRLIVDFPPHKPVFRTIAGGFLNRAEVSARYFRSIRNGPTAVYDGPVENNSEGLFFEVGLGSSRADESVSPFVFAGLTGLHAYSFTLPPLGQNGSQDVEEWFYLWSVAAGLRFRMSNHTSMILGGRFVWNDSLEDANTSPVILPMIALENRF